MRGALSSAIAGALMLAGIAGSANAAVVQTATWSVGSPDAPLLAIVPQSSFTGVFDQSFNGSVSGQTLSPYFFNTLPADQNTAYSVLSRASAGAGTATYNLPVGVTSFQILWGSPDSYNHLQAFSSLNGAGLALDLGGTFGTDLSGTELPCSVGGTCVSTTWALLTISDPNLRSFVLIDDGQAAFEYGLNVQGGQTGEVPLPAAVWLFGTIVAGAFGGAQLRRRRKAA
jgi:hypothetical protein